MDRFRSEIASYINRKDQIGELSLNWRNPISPSGHQFSDLKSALQKAIRRNQSEKALRVLFELDRFFIDWLSAKAILTNFYHRLLIIVLEDIGAPGFQYLEEITELLKYIFERRKVINTNLYSDDMIIDRSCSYLRLVNIFSKIKKSRECSHVRFVFQHYAILIKNGIPLKNAEKFKKNIETLSNYFPNIYNTIKSCEEIKVETQNFFGLDEKTIETLLSQEPTFYNHLTKFLFLLEKKDDRVFYFAFEIANKKTTKSYFRKQNGSGFLLHVLYSIFDNENIKDQIMLCGKLLKELDSTEEVFMTWLLPIITYIRGYSMESTYTLNDDILLQNPFIFDDAMSRNKIKFDEWDIDMHTSKGRQQGKDESDFAREGCKVFPEDEKVNKEYFYMYAMNKYLIVGKTVKEFEKDFNLSTNDDEEELKVIDVEDCEWKYDLIVRAQLVTSDQKTDTYFARYNNMGYFVKGPFFNEESIDIINKIDLLKTNLFCDLDRIDFKIEHLYINKEIESALGIRNKCQDDKRYPFIIFEDLCSFHKMNDIPTKLVKSVKWPETKVVDWDEVKECHYVQDDDIKEKDIFIKYILNLLSRYVIGISDTCIRNLLIHNSKVFSVDEMDMNKPFGFKTTLARKEIIKKGMEKWGDYIIEKVKQWNSKVIEEKDWLQKEIKFVDAFMNRLLFVTKKENVIKILI